MNEGEYWAGSYGFRFKNLIVEIARREEEDLAEFDGRFFVKIKRDNDLDQSLLREMLKVTNGAKTVPQIFINDQYIGGFDDLTEFDLEGGLSEK